MNVKMSQAVDQFSDKDVVPDYTILSHRWMEGEEVTYQEFIKDQEQTRSKAGYKKILRACQWTLVMGGQYLWVDTCCIDNGNHDEIARNIRSMYAYYQNASFCYAYLADVRTHGDFTSSEWWERGWTLQELLAPPRVHFYDKKWRQIGSKHELRHEIAELTDIPQEVLSVDVLERMSWTTGRETTKPQDRAYCLMGLLNVSLKPNYEEHLPFVSPQPK
ncbi:hypothetical protein K435DRAFT_828534 [Dendrothele bispora CBS 962.96]|uniref:Heterokaryon incompatibility domain-containing protein n=1 Tax=Dendrothele bispora (strain CBS 962.96) TaxID=1314807 RepID=A0A4S8M7Q3_DENBC|nr:hypothetical protein K435DRAFT_828534 [Dendrothele bispora CBS 962.96]